MTLPKGIDLRSLEVFLAVADTKSMTKAAERLGMTQSAVSQQINHIEACTGASLIDRQLRPLGITPAGLVLQKRAAHLLLEAGEAWAEVCSVGKAPLPALRLLVQPSLTRTLVPELVFALMKEIPVMNVCVWSGFAMDHEDALLSRQVDILVSTNSLYDIDGLERYELMSEPFIILVPSDIKERDVDLHRLAERLPLVRYSERVPAGRQIEGYLRWIRLKIPRKLEFDSAETVTAVVAAGKGWAISTPSMFLHGFPGTDAVRCLPMPGPGFRRTITLVARAGELGTLPASLAGLCCRVLKDTFWVALRKHVREFNEQVVIGDYDQSTSVPVGLDDASKKSDQT